MRYLSICSGIEAATAAWHPLGWTPAGFAEIERFPSAVLAHHYPDVVNYGDLTKFDEWPDVDMDVLVGGTPCQDLSIAGKRAGLAGERSGLFRDFVACAERYKPRYIVWENVPGSLSTNDSKDIQEVLDSFTQIGYACDIDIHDAQHFGLAQRRRRVFVVCVRLDDFLSKRTPISERIAGELLLQPLVDTWAAILQAWSPDKSLSGYESPTEQSVSSALRRIELLEKALGSSACTRLLSALGASPAPATGEQKPLASASRQPKGKRTDGSGADIGGYPLWSTVGVSGSKSIDTSWKSILDALSAQKSVSTTSTSTPRTIESKISTFAAQSLRIADCIIGSKSCSDQPKWSSDYWNLTSLLLTMLEAITSYARQSSEDLFADPSLRDDWWHYIEQARILAGQSQRNSGDQPSSATLFSLPEGMRRDTPPRRKAGQKTPAPTPESSDCCCAVCGCGRPARKRGWCNTHYQRWRKHGFVAETPVNEPGRSDNERFWEKVEKSDGCWRWTAALNEKGYGIFWSNVEARTVRAHRFAYEKTKGEIEEGLEIDHLCRNRCCVNPDHMEPVTGSENTRRGNAGKHWSEKRGEYDVAPTISARTQGGGGLGTDFDCDGGLIASHDAAQPLLAKSNSSHRADAKSYVAIAFGGANQSGPIDVATAQTAHGGAGRMDFESETFVAFFCKDYGNDAMNDIAPTMRAMGHNGSHANAGGQLAIAIQERAVSENPDAGPDGAGVRDDGAFYTLEARTVPQAVAFAENSRAERRLCGGDGSVSSQLTTGGGKPGQGQPCVAETWAVRRLTPTECERLQGFPDGFTQVPYRGKPAADGPRYKALGNSFAVNVVRWIGQRIQMVEDIDNA